MRTTGKRCHPLIKAQAFVLYSTGMNYCQISKIVKVTRETVRNWCGPGVAEERRKRSREKYQKQKEENPEHYRDYFYEWRYKNIEHVRAYGRHRSKTDRIRINAYNRSYRSKNKEIVSERGKEWRSRNRHITRMHDSRRRAAKQNATPPWLNEYHKEREREIYAEAIRLSIETGVKYHVDHIFPLRGKKWTGNSLQDFCCGLHVYWNLRPIPGSDNHKKWAHVPVDESPTAWDPSECDCHCLYSEAYD